MRHDLKKADFSTGETIVRTKREVVHTQSSLMPLVKPSTFPLVINISVRTVSFPRTAIFNLPLELCHTTSPVSVVHFSSYPATSLVSVNHFSSCHTTSPVSVVHFSSYPAQSESTTF